MSSKGDFNKSFKFLKAMKEKDWLKRIDQYAQEGVNVEFQYTKDSFRKNLRNLNSANNRVLVAELNMGLDSITLRDDLTSYAVLKQLL